MSISSPIVVEIDDNKKALDKFYNSLTEDTKENRIIKSYPTVYIHAWKTGDKYEVYVGESNDFYRRTEEHYNQKNNPKAWESKLTEENSKLYIIAHPNFNKSLTLDIENRLYLYLSSSQSVSKAHNSKENPQNDYYLHEILDEIFSKIWRKLRNINEELFLSEGEIKSSHIFKASPLHKLNNDQLEAKELVLSKIANSTQNSSENNQLIWVEGIWGTGKTVLISSIFYEAIIRANKDLDDENSKKKKLDIAVIVNNKEQLKLYKEIAKKLCLVTNKEKVVFNPNNFINQFVDKKNSPKKRTKPYDIVLVDEAHLLLTRKTQAFNGEQGQLAEIMKYGKVVVAMFHRKQIMNAEQYLSKEEIDKYENTAKREENYIKLTKQMRMNANPEIIDWIEDFCILGKLKPLTKNRGNYEIRVFDSPKLLEKAIKEKAKKEDTKLSRLIATYDWEYKENRQPKNEKYWCVKIDDWCKPWNYQLEKDIQKNKKAKDRDLSWVEQPLTIDEVGSIYTIHGFDLNYAGVIIGPSVKFRNNEVIFDPKSSKNNKATQNRTLKDGSKENFAEDFLSNELGVLLTRGINGIYIYACDEELRNELKRYV